MTATWMTWGVWALPDIVCPIPRTIEHDEARAEFARVKKSMPGLQESAYRREAARRMQVSYDDYLKAWKKPGPAVKPKSTPTPPATLVPRQAQPIEVKPTFVPPQTTIQPMEGWMNTTALPRTTRSYEGADEIEQGLNRLHDVRKTNPFYGRRPKYDVNCVHVVQAHELRRRGFDVEATPLPKQYGRQGRVVSQSLEPAWRERTTGYSRTHSYVSTGDELMRRLIELPAGARGNVRLTWKGKNSGHIWNWEVVEVDGGKVVQMIEAQKGHILEDGAESYFRRGERISYMRMDDLVPTNAAKEFIEPRTPEYIAKEEVQKAREEAKRAARAEEYRRNNEEYLARLVERQAALAKATADNPV